MQCFPATNVNHKTRHAKKIEIEKERLHTTMSGYRLRGDIEQSECVLGDQRSSDVSMTQNLE